MPNLWEPADFEFLVPIMRVLKRILADKSAWLLVWLAGLSPLAAAEATGGSPSEEAKLAARQVKLAPGLEIRVFASEPMIENPVCLEIDERGRVFVVESHRRRTSVFDIRKHPDWVDADLSFRRVEDRAAFLRKTLVPGNDRLPDHIIVDRNGDGIFDWHDLEVESERLRMLEDTDGDGVADRSTVYAEGFNTLVSGVAAGVLVRKGDVHFACIPDLWRLRDTDDDGRADERSVLLSGFGVHIAYGGHDMHGLVMGPDGRIYWSIADRGAAVEYEGRVHSVPHSGAVFRANPDGSDFEVFATGLRNPQELAFDQNGNLWTVDNNGDGGDKSRLVYVVQGGNSGWHIGWQHQPKLGAWNSENLWYEAEENRAAYLNPPVAHISNGPAGLAYYPGTGFSPAYHGRFFLCDFKGGAANSGIHSFRVQPRGAGFVMADKREFLWNLLVTDVDFGPDGSMYVSDWVHGWDKTGQGRVYRVTDPAAEKDPIVKDTHKLLAVGMEEQGYKELSELLAHPDMRVRMEAQFELANRATNRVYRWKGVRLKLSGNKALSTLVRIAKEGPTRQARLHGIWGVAQVGRYSPERGVPELVDLLGDPDDEIRAQTARLIGEHRLREAYERVMLLLQDPSPRVRYFAALGLGYYGAVDGVPALKGMIRENDDKDPWLRHAGALALAMIGDSRVLVAAARDKSPAIRMASLLAMRRLQDEGVAIFLHDPDVRIATEAARAINDVPIEEATGKLALHINRMTFPDEIARRVINACYRMGTPMSARSLAAFAANPEVPSAQRAEALDALGVWGEPALRDRVTGLFRVREPKDPEVAAQPLEPEMDRLLFAGSAEVRLKAIEAASRLGIQSAGPALEGLLRDKGGSESLRLAALNALDQFGYPKLDEMIQVALGTQSEALRKRARELQAGRDDGLEALVEALETGSMGERQVALKALGRRPGRESAKLIFQWMGDLLEGKVAPELRLDVLEAAAAMAVHSPAIQQQVVAFQQQMDPDDPLAEFRVCLKGGDAPAGKKIFYERADVACFRCHRLDGEGGEAGPDLTGIGAKKEREYLLESIILPNRTIAPGYQPLNVTLKNGDFFSGVVRQEKEDSLILESPEEGTVTLKRDDIESLRPGMSSMLPQLGTLLSKQELRDLIEFLAGLE